jgi:uncharacterized protein (TIGR02452 family)
MYKYLISITKMVKKIKQVKKIFEEGLTSTGEESKTSKVIMNKKFLTQIAKDNSAFVEKTKIPIPTTIKVLFDPTQYVKCLLNENTKIMFAVMTTDMCARYCFRNLSKNIAILNYASRRHRCGGYKRGSKAQEESICRACPTFPDSLEGIKYPFEQTSVLMTPDVQIIRDSSDYSFLEEKDIVTVGVVSAAAQDLNEEEFSNEDTTKTLINVYCSVKTYLPKTEILIVGAFGCGAYKNNPYTITEIFNHVNKHYGGLYKYIIFAIPKGLNLKEFKQTIIPFNEDNKPECIYANSDEESSSESEEPELEELQITKTHKKNDRKARSKYALPEDD